MSSVLESAPPRFTADEAARIAADLFGVRGTASGLGSERDQAFLFDDGGRGGVLKISNSGEDEAVLDLEEAAIAHVAAVDPDLPVARPLAPRATFDGHQVRLFERRSRPQGGARARRRRGAGDRRRARASLPGAPVVLPPGRRP